MNKYHFDDAKHIHYLNDEPLMGCSTIVGILNKPIQWWVAEQTLKPLGWQKYNQKVKGGYRIVPDKERLPAIETMLYGIREMKPKVWLDLLDSCYKNHNKKKDEAAVKGTDRHKVLETWVKDCMVNHEGVPTGTTEGVSVFCEWAKTNIKKFLWSEMHGYSSVLWTGGIADVGWLDKDDRLVAGDFKSSKDVYFSQFIQLAGYDTMISENGGYTAQGEKIFDLPRPVEAYCIAPFGQEEDEFDPIILDNVEDFRSAFRSSVHLYKLDKLFTQIKKDGSTRVAAPEPKATTLAELLAAK